MKTSSRIRTTVITVLISIIFSYGYSYSQDSDFQVIEDNYEGMYKKISNLFDNSVGVRFTNFSGYGISYTRKFATDYTVAIVGLARYYEEKQWKNLSKENLMRDNKDISMNFGVEFQRDLFVSTNTRIYALIGGSYTNMDTRNLESGDFELQYSIGFGFGLDWFIHENVSGFFTLAYKYDNINIEEYNVPKLIKKTDIGFGLGMNFHF